MKTVYKKNELKDLVISVVNKDLKELTQIEKEILFTLEYVQYEKVLSDINKQRDKLNLYKPNKFLTFYIPNDKTKDDILFGCQSCLKTKITHIRSSSKCNSSCPFCYFVGVEVPPLPKYGYKTNFFEAVLSKDQLILTLEKQVIPKVDAIGWIDKEPLLELEKIKNVAPFLKDNKVYQYLYTNGTLATEDVLKLLADCGINELRFNLQASNFNPTVLKNMRKAVEIIEHVGIETPIYGDSFNNFLKHKDLILESGIKQINMPELQVSHATIEYFAKKEGELYRNRRGYTSPISSRQYVYRLIEIALQEKWPFIINDCSNETKYFRDTPFIPDNVISGVIQHMTKFNFLPPNHYIFVIDTYIDDALEIF